MLVESVMTRTLVTTEPARSVQSAAQLMRAGHFRHLPVLQRAHLVGIVSDRVVTATALADQQHVPITSLVTHPPVAWTEVGESSCGLEPSPGRGSRGENRATRVGSLVG
jgi:signal-transduction protein with cAMP-binding, CBS, and nucleotidyltransferase domain